MIKTLTRKANAKINLYLRVTGRRDDGYHLIKSVMQSVTLADEVTVSVDTGVRGLSVVLTCTDERIPADGRNIAVKCAYAFFERFGIENCAAEIHIEKKIPVSGGLAGGSTDGAAVLRLLDELLETNADEDSLISLGAFVGADIPFCLVGGCALCEGIGEKLTRIDSAAEYSVLLVSPGGGVSTPEAYRLIDEAGTIPCGCAVGEVVEALQNGSLPEKLHNDFEAVILPINERAAEVKRLLSSFGASAVQMSGSGPTVFGLFERREECENAAEMIKKHGYRAYVCEPERT